MKRRPLPMVILPLALALLASGPKPTPDPQTRALLALHWSGAPQHLSASNSTLVPPKETSVVRGDEAAKFEKIVNGRSDSDSEAIVQDFHSGDYVTLAYTNSGYVTVDDWTSVNPDEMLKSVKENTENGNDDRRSLGLDAVHVMGWLQKPVYDAATKTVRWAIESRQDTIPAPIVNATALMLGRNGYEELVWVTSSKTYTPRGGLLDKVLTDEQFNTGARYRDHAAGDKLAGFGIAALVGTAAGATLYKVGAFAVLLLFLKKLWFLIAAAVLGGYRWLTSRLKPTQFGPPPTAS